MNIDRFEGQWHQVKGQVKEKWGKLTDDDLDIIDGQAEQLAGAIQEAYGIAKEEAEKDARAYLWDLQLDAWTNQLQGKWAQSKGRVREHWGKLTDDDVGTRPDLDRRIRHERLLAARERRHIELTREHDADCERSRPDDQSSPHRTPPSSGCGGVAERPLLDPERLLLPPEGLRLDLVCRFASGAQTSLAPARHDERLRVLPRHPELVPVEVDGSRRAR